MKRIVLLISILLMSFCAIGQNRPRMHAIIFADTYDDKIGPGTDISKTKFGDLLYEIAASINYDDDFEYYTGDACRKATLMNVLDKFHCDTADIVVFCYLGHGGRSLDDTSMFPQMCLHERYQKDFVPLEYVKNRLAVHGARVTWVIGDCCNSYSENIRPKPIEVAGATILPGAATNLIDQLFVKFTGVVTMCASKPGTFGWCNSVTGMYFNNELIRAIESPSINNLIPDRPWSSVMNVVMKNLAGHTFYDKDDVQRTPYKMEPRYKIEPRRRSKHGGEKPPKAIQSNLQKDIMTLANRNLHSIERMRMIPQVIQTHFSDDAVIRTVSKSGNLAYGAPYTPDQYLGKLSRSESIISVVVRKVKTDAMGKVQYLEVHETYKEQ